jgi:hypothetical protein
MIQLSVAVADKPGELARIVGSMAREKIDIRALYLARNLTKPVTGTVKMVVTDIPNALKALKRDGFVAVEERVIVTAVEDHPGGLYAVLTILAEAEINILHAYSFVSRIKGQALSVFGADDIDRAIEVLRHAGVHVLEVAPFMPNEPDLSSYMGGVFYW